MRPLLIVNPRSGGGKTGQLFDEMATPIRRALGDFDLQRTDGPRHAVELSREAAVAGRELVVAVGGDGSIHEVVNGLMQARDRGFSGTRLGVIGQGTGGDFRRTLRLSHRLDRYCAAIAAGHGRRIDVGRFTYVTHDGAPAEAFFVNVLSVGVGGLVDRIVADTSKALGGTLAYLIASARGLVQSRVGRVRISAAHGGQRREEQVSTRLLAICNGGYFGSGMNVAPMAAPDDGRFEVVDLGGAGMIRFAAVNSAMYTGKHIRHSDVRHYGCDRIEVELLDADVAERFLLDVDGEPLGRPPFAVTLERGAIEVLAPPP